MLDNIIQNTTVQYEDEYFTYQDICAKWINECFKNDILNLDYILDDVSCAHNLKSMLFLHRAIFYIDFWINGVIVYEFTRFAPKIRFRSTFTSAKTLELTNCTTFYNIYRVF